MYTESIYVSLNLKEELSGGAEVTRVAEQEPEQAERRLHRRRGPGSPQKPPELTRRLLRWS